MKMKVDEQQRAHEASFKPVMGFARTVIFLQPWKNNEVGMSSRMQFQQMVGSEQWMVYNTSSDYRYFYKCMTTAEIDLFFTFVDTELKFYQLVEAIEKKYADANTNLKATLAQK